MKVAERNENRLVLKDSQLDKKLGIGIASAVLLFMAYQFASGGTRDDFLIALVPLALVAGMAFYLWKTMLTSVFTFDRTTDTVTLVVTNRKGRETWDWKLSDIASTEVSEVRSTSDPQSAVRNTNKQPVFVLKDGTKVPMRPTTRQAANPGRRSRRSGNSWAIHAGMIFRSAGFMWTMIERKRPE